jgi:hypothetical protein
MTEQEQEQKRQKLFILCMENHTITRPLTKDRKIRSFLKVCKKHKLLNNYVEAWGFVRFNLAKKGFDNLKNVALENYHKRSLDIHNISSEYYEKLAIKVVPAYSNLKYLIY